MIECMLFQIFPILFNFSYCRQARGSKDSGKMIARDEQLSMEVHHQSRSQVHNQYTSNTWKHLLEYIWMILWATYWGVAEYQTERWENLLGSSWIICFISSSNPMSRILSASSIMRHWRFLNRKSLVFWGKMMHKCVINLKKTHKLHTSLVEGCNKIIYTIPNKQAKKYYTIIYICQLSI